MLSIAIIEDTESDYERLRNQIDEFTRSHGTPFRISRFVDAESFLDGYRSDYDLVFMDIELPGLSGMRAAHALRDLDESVTLVFLTRIASLAVNGYEVNALDYMIKPVNEIAFDLKMKRFVKNIESKRSLTVTIPTKHGIARIAASSIHYVEVAGHNLIFHTEQGTFVSRGTMKKLEETLSPHHFLRCNHCYLVNLQAVVCVEDCMVHLVDAELPISRAKRKSFLDGLAAYLSIA